MSENVARAAAAIVGVDTPTEVALIASGRSSAAWRVQSDGNDLVVRIPIPNSGRRMTYLAEAQVCGLLESHGLPVATWTVVDCEGSLCSVAPRLPGQPVKEQRWHDNLAHDVAAVLHATHTLAHRGAGPLAMDPGPGRSESSKTRPWEGWSDVVQGTSSGLVSGICDRWFHATIWPFDGSTLDDHTLTAVAPGLVDSVRQHRAQIMKAGVTAPLGVCHSDLHAEHVLVDGATLSGLLDFGDAFIGAIAWDIALLLHYYGEHNTAAVLSHYPDGDALFAPATELAIAVAMYKIAKTPDRPALVDSLRTALM